jgi:hypothetical protein
MRGGTSEAAIVNKQVRMLTVLATSYFMHISSTHSASSMADRAYKLAVNELGTGDLT